MSGYVVRGRMPHVEMAQGETLDWSRDWSSALEPGEELQQSAWEIAAGLSAGIASRAGVITTQWLTAVTTGAHAVTNEVRTTAGRVMRRTLIVNVLAQR